MASTGVSSSCSRSPTTQRADPSAGARCAASAEMSTAASPHHAGCRDTVPAAAVRGSASAIAAPNAAIAAPAPSMVGGSSGRPCVPSARQCAAGGSQVVSARRCSRSRSSSGPSDHASHPPGEIAGWIRPRATTPRAWRATTAQARSVVETFGSSWGRSISSSSSWVTDRCCASRRTRVAPPPSRGSTNSTGAAPSPTDASGSVGHSASTVVRGGSPGTMVACQPGSNMTTEPTSWP